MRRWPAEWEPHEATWIAWPHHEPDWPGKLAPIPWVYAEIARVLHRNERVEILCQDELVREDATRHLDAHGVKSNVRVHLVPTDRVWLRDSSPTWVERDRKPELVNWRFNAWAKYDNYARDEKVGKAIEKITKVSRIEPARPNGSERVVLEGGAIDGDGEGLLLTTEECLLSDVQARNPGMTRDEYEQAFREYLGIRETIWLGEGCVGDDTHGHVDDIARFVAPGVIVLAYEADPSDENHLRSLDNMRRLDLAGAAAGAIKVVKLPYPRPVTMQGERLPASYANFYIGNERRDRADLQRPCRSSRDEHPRRADARPRNRRHSRGGSRVGAGHTALPDAATAFGSAPHVIVKITLLSDESIRLEPGPGPMTIEAVEPDQLYSPFHMLASSLAFCTFSVMQAWATSTTQPADDLVLEVRWRFSQDEPKRVSEMHLTFAWPSLPGRKRDAAKRVAELCTIHATLHHPPTVTTEPADSAA